MKNWILFGAMFVASMVIVVTVLVLWKADAPFTDMEKQAEQLALSSNKLAQVTESYTYNGNNPYVTVIGTDDEGREKALFVPISMDEKLIQQAYMDEGITKEKALSVLASETKVSEILHTKLGFEEAGVVWEISYLNEKDDLNYVYILFEDGQWWKRILNL
ncbi:MAG: DUF5590 domain-containing protein [Lysinibacillus sp.]